MAPRHSTNVSGPGDQKRWSNRREPVDAAIARLAARGHGVVCLAQLIALGLSYDEVRGRVERGTLHPLHRGVYAVGHRKLTREGHLMAALLAAGPGAFLSHRTAAGLHGLRAVNMRAIEVTVVARCRRRREAIRLHSTGMRPAAGELTSKNGLTLSTVPRLLVELSERETETELLRLITAAVRRQILNHDALELALARHSARPGIKRLGRAYAAYRPRPERNSDLERAFDRLLETHPEIPEPLRNVWQGQWELDYYWPAQRLVLELDGRPYHVAVKDIERDRLRDAQLLGSGIATLRITDRRYNDDPGGALADLLAALERRAA